MSRPAGVHLASLLDMADPCSYAKGNREGDVSLRGTENVPWDGVLDQIRATLDEVKQ